MLAIFHHRGAGRLGVDQAAKAVSQAGMDWRSRTGRALPNSSDYDGVSAHPTTHLVRHLPTWDLLTIGQQVGFGETRSKTLLSSEHPAASGPKR